MESVPANAKLDSFEASSFTELEDTEDDEDEDFEDDEDDDLDAIFAMDRAR